MTARYLGMNRSDGLTVRDSASISASDTCSISERDNFFMVFTPFKPVRRQRYARR